MMRRMGGWIESDASGHRVRTRSGGRKKTIETCATREEAEALLGGIARLRAKGAVDPVDTVRAYGKDWLDRRETVRKLRAVDNDRNRWKNYIDAHAIADEPIAGVQRRHVREWMSWLETRGIGWQTRKHCLNLLRGCLAHAVHEERRADNPAAGMKVEKPADAHETEGWTYLLPDEQSRLLTTAPPELRADVLMAAFALGTGLRQGEQWALELRDVHLDDESPWLLVRWGSPGKPPKSGKMRRVPIFGIALAALREWLAFLPTYTKRRNPHGLVFPTERGCRRVGKPPRGWAELLRRTGLAGDARHDGRSIRWHDLRHTCASSLVAGWWGEPWALIEVREILGHASVTTTELYAHLAPGVLAAAAGRVRGNPLPRTEPDAVAELPETTGRATQDSNLRPSAPEGAEDLSDLDLVRTLAGHLQGTEEKMLRAVASRSRLVRSAAVELAEASRAFREAVERLVVPAERPRLRAVKGGR